MKLFLTVIVLAQIGSSFSQDDQLLQDAISKIPVGLRCKELLRQRTDKIKLQQRLNGLLQRNQDLLKSAPVAKETLHNRLRANQIKIKNELHLTNLSIEAMEENIIRSGCPGINL
jgi:hypothetical protein